tara:strand:- start:1012 stop:1230 length:219 start_codon:yes stop_codon:yes gene_type:complete
MEKNPRPFVQLDWNVSDVKLLYNAVDFYLKKRMDALTEEEIQQKLYSEPTSQVIEMKNQLYRVILENSLYKS